MLNWAIWPPKPKPVSKSPPYRRWSNGFSNPIIPPIIDAYDCIIIDEAHRGYTLDQEIAASIIGYIRQAALGEALLPFEQRLNLAMQKIYMLHDWTPVQRKWLERLAKQLSHEVVIDQHFVNRAFAQDGGTKRLNSLLDGDLDKVLDMLSENLWQTTR